MIQRFVLRLLAFAQSVRYDVDGVRNDVLNLVSSIVILFILIVFAPLVLG